MNQNGYSLDQRYSSPIRSTSRQHTEQHSGVDASPAVNSSSDEKRTAFSAVSAALAALRCELGINGYKLSDAHCAEDSPSTEHDPQESPCRRSVPQ